MILIGAAGLIWLACFGFYAVSSKQILKTQQSQYALIAAYPNWVKAAAASLLLLVLCLLRTQLSSSISFVALWILISLILFIFILKINNLEGKRKP